MRTVEMLDEAIATARRMGYHIRHEWLGGTGGGACEFSGRRWIFIDLALTVDEQLDQVGEALRADPSVHLQALTPALEQALDLRRAA